MAPAKNARINSPLKKEMVYIVERNDTFIEELVYLAKAFNAFRRK